jgi:AcrR family transcriptional regulator
VGGRQQKVEAGLSRKERERLRHRREILAAAERVFTRKGYHSATIEEIAQEAEFAVGTIYNFFTGKEGLYECILHQRMSVFIDTLDTVLEGVDSPVVAIERLIDLRLAQLEEHWALFRMFFESLPQGRFGTRKALSESCTELHDHYTRRVRLLLEQGCGQGLFSAGDPLCLALAMDGAINEFIAYWLYRESEHPSPAQVRDLKHSVLRALGCGGDAAERRASSPATPGTHP